MTAHEKEILIEKMLDPTEPLSDADVAEILDDAELRDLYGISLRMQRPLPVEVNKEWRLMRGRIAPKSTPTWRVVLRVAAVMVGVALLCAAMLRVINPPSSTPSAQLMAQCGERVLAGAVKDVVDVQSDLHPLELVADKPVKAKPRKVAKSPADGYSAVDVDELLRLEQARLDNELAVQRAQEIIARYFATCEWDAVEYAEDFPPEQPDLSNTNLVTLIIQ